VGPFEVRLGDCFDAGLAMRFARLTAAELLVAVEVLGAVTGATGVAEAGVGATEAWGAGRRWWAGADTTMLSAGGALEIPPVEGRCKVPESRNRAIAPAPRSSGIATSAARRAMRASSPIITFPAAAAPDYAIPLPT
jgi:hypothetical protein